VKIKILTLMLWLLGLNSVVDATIRIYVEISGDTVEVQYSEGTSVLVYAPDTPSFIYTP